MVLFPTAEQFQFSCLHRYCAVKWFRIKRIHPNQSNSNTFKQFQCIENNRQQKRKRIKKILFSFVCDGTMEHWSNIVSLIFLCICVLSQTATQFIMLKVNFCCHCRSYLNKYASHIHTRTLHYIWMVGKFAFHLCLEQ